MFTPKKYSANNTPTVSTPRISSLNRNFKGTENATIGKTKRPINGDTLI